MIYLQLFLSMFQIGLFSVGGGYVAIPLIQHQVVELHGWLSATEFTDIITIAEMTPGPIAINSATFVGIRVAGIPGALVATFGCVLPSSFQQVKGPAVLIFAAALLGLRRFRLSPLRVMAGAGAAGLILYPLLGL